MTILGFHSITECQDLVRTIEFRIQETDKVYSTITSAFRSANPAIAQDLDFDWAAFKKRWRDGIDSILASLTLLDASQPLVPASSIPAEGQYLQIKKLQNVSGTDTFAKGDLQDCIQRIQVAANTQIDESNAPVPSSFDPDFAAYKKLDTTIKAGEAAAKAAANGAGNIVKSNWPLFLGLGVGVTALTVGGLIVAKKVYLP